MGRGRQTPDTWDLGYQDPMAFAQLPGGDLLVGCSDGLIWAIDPATGYRRVSYSRRPETACLGRHSAPVVYLATAPSGRWVAASDDSGQVALWSTGTVGKVGHKGYIEKPKAWFRPTPECWGSPAPELAWTSSGDHLVTWKVGELPVQLWSTEGLPVWTGPKVSNLAISPTGDRLAGISEGQLWLRDPGGEAYQIPLPTRIPGVATCVDFSTDGKHIAVGTDRREVVVIDVATQDICWNRHFGNMLGLIGAQSISNIHWSPNGEWLGFMVGRGMFWPAVVETSDGDVVCGNLFLGGQGDGSLKDFSWTRDNRMLCTWGRVFVLDVETEKQTQLSPDWDERHLLLADGKNWVGYASHKLSAVNLKTGKVQWVQ